MAKRKRTPAQIEADKARMARVRAAREKHVNEVIPEATPEPVQANTDNADIGELLARIKELENRLPVPQPQQETPQISQRGTLVGTFERYITDPKHYPNPCERLSHETKLQRFAFSDNFELIFEIGMSSYETKDNRNVKEPKFALKLIRVMYDDDTGEKTDQRYVASTLTFHEDPGTALIIAHENGFDVDSLGEKEFLDEMRYMRMRDWLLECFYPPAPPASANKKEMVIGNKLVEVYTVNNEEGEKAPSIPFGTFIKKL